MGLPTDAGVTGFFRRAAWVMASLCTAIGLTGLVGWCVDAPTLVRLSPSLAAMKFNTAVGLTFLGVALLLTLADPLAPRPRRRVQLLTAVPIVVGALTLFEWASDVDLGLDQLVFTDRVTAAANHPGRITIATSSALVGLGLSTAFLHVKIGSARPAHYLARISNLICLAVVLGYLYNVEAVYAIRPFATMALHTALALIFAGLTLLVGFPDTGIPQSMARKTPGGLMIRRLFPLVVFLPAIFGWAEVTGARAGWFQAEFGAAVFAVPHMFIVGLMIWLAARAIDRGHAARLLAERAVRDSEQDLRITLDSIGDGVIATDREGRVTRMNPLAVQLTGWPLAEALGQPLAKVFDIVAMDTRVVVESPVVRVLREGAVVGHANPTLLIARDGHERAITDSAAPIRDEAGAMRGVVLAFRDQTAERDAERALRMSEARKAAMMEAALDAILLMDHTGAILEFNPAAERLFGHARADVLGQPLADVIIPEHLRQAHRDGLTRHLATGTARVLGNRFEASALGAGGVEFPAEIALVRIDADGAPVFTGYIRDLTTEREAAEARVLRVAKDAAEAANAELETFSYSVAHDLRGPLRAIGGLSAAVVEDAGAVLDADSVRNLGYVIAAAGQMNQLIDALLDLGRLTRAELRVEAVDLVELAHEVIAELRRAHPARTVEVTVLERATVQGDRRLLRAMLENLLGNAWKFTRNRADARVELGREDTETGPVYFVRDNGAGFDLASAERLFTPFRRFHHGSAFEGSGVGLATVQRIVRRHAGRIWADAAVDRGATFRFTLAPPRRSSSPELPPVASRG